MALQNNFLLVPLLAVFLCAALMGIYVWWNRRTPEARTLALLMLAVAIWSLFYMLELGADRLPDKLMWARVKYFGVVVAPTAWFIFILQYCGQHHRLNRKILAFLSIMPLVTLIFVWTNDAHHLFWKSVSLYEALGYSILFLPIGPALWFCAGYNYVLLSLGLILLIKTAVRSPRFRRRQSLAIIVASLAPVCGNFFYSLGISPIPHLDLTPFCFAGTCFACAWAFLSLRIVGIVPEAYKAVIQSMDDAVLVLDAGERIVDINPAAQKLLGSIHGRAVGCAVETVLAEWPALMEWYRKGTELQTEIILEAGASTRKFNASLIPLHNQRGTQVGSLIVLREITDRAKAENALKESEQRYRTLVEQARDIICTIDLKSGIVTSANDYAARTLGYKMVDTINKMSFLELVHPGDHENVIMRLQGLAVERKRVPNFPLRLLKADGSVIHVEVNGSITYDDRGNPENFVGVLRDVTDKTLSEEALRESEERYRTLVDHSLTGVCLLQDGKYHFANRHLARISGYDIEELSGMSFEKLVHPDDLLMVKEIVQRRMTGEDPTGQHQFRAIRRDGKVIWIETLGAPIEYKGKPALLINAVDITERRRVDEALQLTQFTVDNAPDPVFWMRANARFVYVNEAACRTLGYSREELLSMTVHDIDPDFPKDVWPDHWRELKRERTMVLESHHRTKSGKIFPVAITVNLLEFMGREYNCAVAHDISNRKAAELKIRKSEERYRALFEKSKDCVFIALPQGTFLDINPAGVKLFGYSSKEELLRANLWDDLYVCSEDREKFQSMILKEGFVKDYQLLLKRKDGKHLDALVTANVFRDEDHQTMVYRGILRDITEHKQLERQLLQAQKMEGIGTLAGGIAHDFNNILGGILGYASFMKSKMDDNHPFYRYVNTIESGATRAAELTSQLLAFARGGKYETRPINLNRIIGETLKLIGRTFEKSIEITVDLYPTLPSVEADAGQMQQVLMNLCVNAADAMPSGGRLVIETGIEHLTEIHVGKESEVEARNYVCLTVSDTGIGMEPETIERIFEPFFTRKKEGKGTGLGLSMVYGVIKNHGGFIDVKSAPGEGTTFKVHLPASEKPESVQHADYEEPSGGNELILVVDDEEAIRALAKEILEDYGYRVLLATDGVEGFEVFRKYNGSIGLVILDMIMPKLGGRDTFVKMKELNPHVRALLSTGYSREGKADEILEDGAMGFVQKPYQANSLLAAVRNVLDRETNS